MSDLNNGQFVMWNAEDGTAAYGQIVNLNNATADVAGHDMGADGILSPNGTTQTLSNADLSPLDYDAAEEPAKAEELDAPDTQKISQSPADYLYVPDKDHPSTWKLFAGDPAHLEMAITALEPGGFDGQKVDIPTDATPDVLARAKRMIDALPSGDAQAQQFKDHLLARYDKMPAVRDLVRRSDGSQPVHAPTPTTDVPDGDPKTGAAVGKGIASGAIYEDGAIDTSIKSLPDGDGWKVGGYLVVFTDETAKDITGEFFTDNTEFELDGKPRPMLWHHGKDGSLKATAVGTITSIVKDEIGLWAEAQLVKANRYAAAIKDMIGTGKLGWSSGAYPDRVRKAANGKITHWAIKEGSATPTPAMPLLTTIAPLSAVNSSKAHFAEPFIVAAACKALNIDTDEFTLQEAEATRAQKSTRAGNGANNKSAVVNVLNSSNNSPQVQEKTQMSDLELQAAFDKMRAAEKDADAAAAEKSAAAAAIAELAALKATIAAQAEEAKRVADAQDAAKSVSSKQAASSLPIATKGADPVRIQITRPTRYSGLSATDMSFMADTMIRMNKVRTDGENWVMTQQFARELADKSTKAVARGELPYDAVKSLDDAALIDDNGAIKAGELDNTGTTAGGVEWVADSWRSELWLRVRQDNVVAPNLQMLDMPTNPYELPIESTDPTVYYAPETTDQTMLVYTSANPIPESKAATGKVQMSAKKLAVRMAWSAELNEDSIIPIVANYRRQAIRAVADGIDNVLINGDTATGANTNINLIDGTPTANTKYLAFNGLRKYCLVTFTGQALNAAGTGTGPAAISLPLLRKLRFALKGDYALRPRDLAFIVDDSTYAKLLSLPEFVTVDKMGPDATNVNGLIGQVDGIQVLASAQFGLSQGTNGEQSTTAANNKYGNVLCVFKPLWYVGYRRQVTANMDFISAFDAYHLVITARLTLAAQDQNATGQAASYMYNIAV